MGKVYRDREKLIQFRVLAESTGGFIVEAESEEQAREMVLDHMHRVGTPYKSAPGAAISVLPSGEDKILSIDRYDPNMNRRLDEVSNG